MKVQDIGVCIEIRTSVRENHFSLEALAQACITESSVAGLLATTPRGWVCEADGRLVGFSMANLSNGEFWVVAVLPAYEKRGIGRTLMNLAIEWLWSAGHQQIWLWTSPSTHTRAYTLYQKSGWEDCGVQENQRIMKLRKN